MRKFLLLLIPLLFAAVGNAKKLEAYFAYSTFYSSESGPYIETYLSVVGGSLVHKAIENNKYQGKLEVIYIFFPTPVKMIYLVVLVNNNIITEISVFDYVC
mgnify:CR=1 FL=1